MPISEGVSGSYNAAATARDMVLAEEPDRNIHLVNSRAAGGKMDLIFLLFDRYLASNPDVSFEDACAYFDSLEQNSKILFSLCNYENLAKAGRIPKAAGVIANKLNIRILGTASEAGKIELVGHTRGEKKMFNKIIDTMEAEGFTGGEVVIDHVENEAGAQALASRIVERWPGSKTVIMPCNGLDSYYAEMHGLIIGYGMGVASGK
jgi:DegV family protein with EDD domain